MAAVQKGKSYKRRVKAHTLGMEAMFRFMAVIRTMVARQTRPPRQYKSYNVSTRQTIQVCRESVANSEDLQEVLPDLCQNKFHYLCTMSFSQVWTDMAIEQSINLDSKKGGGIIGITKQPGALDRWFLISDERAAMTSATKLMCGLQESQ